MQFLLCIPHLAEEQGSLPQIPPGSYVGYFNAMQRRLVFIFDPRQNHAHLYFSSEGWEKAFLMQEGRLPDAIELDSHETAWAVACWKAVQLQLKTKTF